MVSGVSATRDAALRTIAVVTTARSDYGIVRPILSAIAESPSLVPHLIVGGMHLVREYGFTVDAIERDGFAIGDRVEMLVAADSPVGIAKSIGLGVLGFAESLSRRRPDLLLVTGDRFEMYAAAVAALPLAIPVAHVHGGECSAGAIDDALRHSMTKLSHLHFASTADAARRIVQLGEEPWRVTITGAPALDALATVELLSPRRLAERFGVPFDPAPLLVTYHPETLAAERSAEFIDELLAALAGRSEPLVFTLPNADTNGRIIAERIRRFVATRANAVILDNLGTQAYFSVLAVASAMVGNSSSGILEAASFRLPVVNVGDRQAGRFAPRNVVHSDNARDAIAAAIERATSPRFRSDLRGLENPYATGRAARDIAARLAAVAIDRTLLVKRFHDAPAAPVALAG